MREDRNRDMNEEITCLSHMAQGKRRGQNEKSGKKSGLYKKIPFILVSLVTMPAGIYGGKKKRGLLWPLKSGKRLKGLGPYS